VVQTHEGDPTASWRFEEEARKLVPLTRDIMELTVEPGWYRIKHLSAQGRPPSGMYGESRMFEVKDDEEHVVEVDVYPAI